MLPQGDDRRSRSRNRCPAAAATNRRDHTSSTGETRDLGNGFWLRAELRVIVEVFEDLGRVRPLLGWNDEIDVPSAELIERMVCDA